MIIEPKKAFYCCKMSKKSMLIMLWSTVDHRLWSLIILWLTVDHVWSMLITLWSTVDHTLWSLIIDHCHERLLIIYDQHWSVYHIMTTMIHWWYIITRNKEVDHVHNCPQSLTSGHSLGMRLVQLSTLLLAETARGDLKGITSSAARFSAFWTLNN